MESYREREAKRQRLKASDAEAYIGQDGAVSCDDKEEPVIPKVPFAACLERMVGDELVESYESAALAGRRTTASKRTRFASFPPYLMLALKRYYVGEGWVPMKLDALVDMPERLDLNHLRGAGQQPGEQLQPDSGQQQPPASAATAAPPPQAAVVPDSSLVAQLVSMGFGENGCRRAAVATGNSGVEAAMEWVLGHMEDADFDQPLPEPVSQAAAATAEPGEEEDPEKVAMLGGMGFSDLHAKAALKVSEDEKGSAILCLVHAHASSGRLTCLSSPRAPGLLRQH